MNLKTKWRLWKIKRDVIKWNKETFPDNTFHNQQLKHLKEVIELEDALRSGDEESIREEMADVLISNFGLHRFPERRKKDEKFLINSLFTMAKMLRFDLINEMQNKMNINKCRFFEVQIDGTHQHVQPAFMIESEDYEKTKH